MTKRAGPNSSDEVRGLRVYGAPPSLGKAALSRCRPFSGSLMIADKGFLHSNWPADFDRRQRHSYDGYTAQEAGLKRRSTISHPRVEPHDLASFGAASV